MTARMWFVVERTRHATTKQQKIINTEKVSYLLPQSIFDVTCRRNS